MIFKVHTIFEETVYTVLGRNFVQSEVFEKLV